MLSHRIGLAQLAQLQRHWTALLPAVFHDLAGQDDGVLSETAAFGSNPGKLRMLSFVPPNLPAGAPLVVVLHGCGQDAGSFDAETGWSVLAERHGFALLYPQQRRSNNAHGCFTWFEPGDGERGGGERESVRQMVAAMMLGQRCDPARVYVTGLSAGAAMVAALLATHPELFAAGAIIAGLPFGAAAGAREAMSAMAHSRERSAAAWGSMVRAASPGAERRPVVAIWHGDADTTVSPGNAVESAKQWTDVHGIPETAGQEDVVDGVTHRVWRDGAGRVCVELYAVPGLSHGVPIASDAEGDHGVGRTGRFVRQSAIASTWHIARAWGLVPADACGEASPVKPARAEPMQLIGRGVQKLVRALS